MRITFDPTKAAANVRKHGVSFSDAEAVLFDPMTLTREDPDAEGEERFVFIGMGATGRIIVVVWCTRTSVKISG